MGKPLIVVGIGDHLPRDLAKPLRTLTERGLVKFSHTVDLHDRTALEGLDDVAHAIRAPPDQPFRKTVPGVDARPAIIILGHANHRHVPDAITAILEKYGGVFLEKPYATTKEGLDALKVINSMDPNRLVLLEYGLQMKGAPMLAMAGLLNPKSFYFQEGLLRVNAQASRIGITPEMPFYDLTSRIHDLVGRPKHIRVDYLEGEGQTGRLEHRGPSLYIRSLGGGMIQDLFQHSLSTLVALESRIGEIQRPQEGDVRIALASDLEKYITANHPGTPARDVGETYAEIDLVTSSDIPILVRLGKYTPKDANQRNVTIVGDTGTTLVYDFSNIGVTLMRPGEEPVRVLDMPKSYYPVLRSAYDINDGDSPFCFDSNQVCFDTQYLLFRILDRIENQKSDMVRYATGTPPEKIFAK